jgi:hypothetical protein
MRGCGRNCEFAAAPGKPLLAADERILKGRTRPAAAARLGQTNYSGAAGAVVRTGTLRAQAMPRPDVAHLVGQLSATRPQPDLQRQSDGRPFIGRR